jgi:hypothetical protein
LLAGIFASVFSLGIIYVTKFNARHKQVLAVFLKSFQRFGTGITIIAV